MFTKRVAKSMSSIVNPWSLARRLTVAGAGCPDESDSSGHPAVATVKRLAQEQGLTTNDIDFATRLVNMCENQREHLDSRISKIASQYPSEQMPLVERNILRVAIAELEMADAAPEGVVANEAVELARLFGSNSSPKFVNGVLGALLG